VSNRWIILVSGFVLNLMLGVVYSWSVFVRPLMNSYGWTKTTATLPFTIFLAVFALMMVPAGRAQDKIGPRKVAMIGGILLGAGFILASFISHFGTPIWLFLTYGLTAGAGCGLGYACSIPPARKWFPDKPGLAVGLVVMGFGMSALLFAPLQRQLIDSLGVPAAFLTIGIILLVFATLSASLMKNPPEGWKPENWQPPRPANPAAASPRADYEPREAVSSLRFWMLWLMYTFMAAAGLMVIGHIAAYTEELGIAAMYAALAAGVLSAFNAAGRPGGGLIADKLGIVKAMLIIFTFQGIIMLLFPHVAVSLATILIVVSIIGFNYGANFAIFPTATAEGFGVKNLGVNYGLVFTSYGVGGVLGPLTGSYVYDSTQSYAAAFTVAAVIAFVAVVIALVYQVRYGKGR